MVNRLLHLLLLLRVIRYKVDHTRLHSRKSSCRVCHHRRHGGNHRMRTLGMVRLVVVMRCMRSRGRLLACNFLKTGITSTAATLSLSAFINAASGCASSNCDEDSCTDGDPESKLLVVLVGSGVGG